MKNWVATGALALFAVALIFFGPIASSVTRIGEGAINKVRKYKDARRELAEPKPPVANETAPDTAAEPEGVEGERRKTYEKELVNVGYWQSRENGQRRAVDPSDPPDRRSAMQSRREDLNKRGASSGRR